MDNGATGKFTFQAVDNLQQTLLAVSDINAKGNAGWFDKKESCILPAGCPELNQIRAIVQKAKNKVPMYVRNGVFRMRTHLAEGPFGRQGP